MSDQRESWSRREFVSGLTLAGTAGFAGIRPARVGAEPPPETTRLRLYHSPSVCVAPQYIVGELLKAEGFSDIKYVKTTTAGISKVLASGKVDAYLAFPPDPQELRARKLGHVVVNSTVDRPWSQYFCCMATGNREFVRKHPIATKRALRAILKAAAICALEPERAARALVDGGFTSRYDYALATMKDVPYDKWRVYDPEDSVRFYALRLHEAGMLKASPQKIIALGR